MIATPECKSCRFLRETVTDGVRNTCCQRHAPTPAMVPARELPRDRPWAVWPEVSYRDWCGEYQPRTS
jgi:hypothetical protein